ncbi:gem-associated protein 8-like [Asterias rubens]|uniref:gem-associated protein 8-like n=1 Tax=Asterias rubens TaxID=7604 RepID=UPI001455BCC6|nr:gem-associated protein 8-like [Asterias rubens]XP_033646278.1 gem-associated protein 8-like [Asterias rubens]XP_033646279.1 gem-associated protein 8-like [Asterias rubens]
MIMDAGLITDEDGFGKEENTNPMHLNHPWYYQPQYDRYWQHYSAMQSWMRSYLVMLRNRHPAFNYPSMTNQCYSYPSYSTSYPVMGGPLPSWNTGNQHRDQSPYYHHTFSHARGHHYNESEFNNPDEYPAEGRSSDDESMEIEMSQEMIDFFKTSQKFREERDKAKAQAANTERKGNERKKKKNHRMESSDYRAPVERPDEGRRKEMKVLYGKDCARIHGMETAMQMQFDRNCDRFTPAFWPIVAIKM